jgi:hypothetical protein
MRQVLQEAPAALAEMEHSAREVITAVQQVPEAPADRVAPYISEDWRDKVMEIFLTLRVPVERSRSLAVSRPVQEAPAALEEIRVAAAVKMAPEAREGWEAPRARSLLVVR